MTTIIIITFGRKTVGLSVEKFLLRMAAEEDG
jgi:hypothetical protein